MSVLTPDGVRTARFEPGRAYEAPITQQEIATVLGVHRSRVFQLEQRALKKLRKGIEQDAADHGKTVGECLRGE